MLFHSILILGSSIVFVFTKNIFFIIGSAALSFAAFFIWNIVQQKRSTFLVEAANLVSSTRLLTLLILPFFILQLSDHWIGGIALLVLILDGLDGYLARKYKTTSLFGSYLDMETDAFFVLVLTSILFFQEKFGLWILALGWLRYVYFITISFFKPVEKKEDRDYFAQVIAVVFMGSLVACFFLPESFYVPAVVLSSGLLLFSFGKSFVRVISN